MSQYFYDRKTASQALISISEVLKIQGFSYANTIKDIAKNLLKKKKISTVFVGMDIGSGDEDIVMVWKRTPGGVMKVTSFTQIKPLK